MDGRDEACPRCGSRRLIRREVILADTGTRGWTTYLRLSARLWPRLWRHRRRAGAIVRHARHCEICGCDWGREVWREHPPEAPPA